MKKGMFVMEKKSQYVQFVQDNAGNRGTAKEVANLNNKPVVIVPGVAEGPVKKDLSKERDKDIDWVRLALSGGSGFLAHQIMSGIFGDDDDGNDSAWKRALKTLIPIAAGGLGAYGGWKLYDNLDFIKKSDDAKPADGQGGHPSSPVETKIVAHGWKDTKDPDSKPFPVLNVRKGQTQDEIDKERNAVIALMEQSENENRSPVDILNDNKDEAFYYALGEGAAQVPGWLATYKTGKGAVNDWVSYWRTSRNPVYPGAKETKTVPAARDESGRLIPAHKVTTTLQQKAIKELELLRASKEELMSQLRNMSPRDARYNSIMERVRKIEGDITSKSQEVSGNYATMRGAKWNRTKAIAKGTTSALLGGLTLWDLKEALTDLSNFKTLKERGTRMTPEAQKFRKNNGQ